MKDTQVNTPEFHRHLVGFEKELKKEGKGEIYINQQKGRLMEFFNYVESIGINAITDINQSVANKYKQYMEQERLNRNYGGRLKQTTIKLHKGAIHKLWKYFNVEGIQANAIWIAQKKLPKPENITVLTQKEIQLLYSVCDTTGLGYRDRAVLAIHYGCGLRNGEGLRLLITDFDFNNNKIRIRKSKNNCERYVVMIPKVKQYIEEYIYHYRDLYLEKLDNPDAFFIGVEGTRLHKKSLLTRLQKLWSMVKNTYESKKHIGLHTLRHSIGTHLYMATKDIEMVALMLGHTALGTTQVYIHLTNKLENEQI
jgi:integrase/recombinase XerD